MATASEEALRAIFEQIRDERKTHANTATRIGDAFLSLLSHLDNGTFLKQGDTKSREYILSVTGGASASLTKLFTLETVTEQGEERVTLATPLAPFKELELRDYLQIGDARLRWDSERQALYVTGKDGSTPVGFYSTGWISALGANDGEGEGGGGGGGLAYSRLDSWEGYSDEEQAGWVLSAYLGYRLYRDVNELKQGAAISYVTQGTGNAVTDVTKLNGQLVFTRGKTFSELGHTHPLSNIYDLHSSWDAVLKAQKPNWLTAVSLSTISDLHANWDAILKAAPTDYVTRWPTAAEVGALTQATADSRYALKTVTITAGAGLSGGGNLSANRTLSLAAVGTAGTYTKVTVDAYGRVTAHASLSAADIPTLAISKISGLQAALDKKLEATAFNELFEKVTLADGTTAIRAKYGLYTDSFLSAKGANPEAGTLPVGATTLDELEDVTIDRPVSGQTLVYDGFTWRNQEAAGGLDEDELSAWLTNHQYALKGDITIALSGYATQTWVKQQGYITAAALSGYATQTWVNQKLASYYTSAQMDTLLSGKVDKVEGKGLSSNDFTDALLAKLNGIAAGANKYTLPTATDTTLGGVKVGATLAIASSVLNLKATGTAGTYTKVTTDAYGRVTAGAKLAASDIPSLDWSKITSGKPTTLSGYGITDGVTTPAYTGSGNVLTAASISGHTITFTKGITAALASRKVTAGKGLTGGGTLTADITLNVASANAGISVNADNIQLNTINALTSTDTVKPLSAAQGKKIWDFVTDLFEKVNIGTSSAPVYAIRAKYGLFSDEFLSAKGANDSEGEGGGLAYNRLDTWDGYSDALAGWVLSAGLGYSLYTDVKSLKQGAAVSLVTTGSGNAVTDIAKSGTKLTVTKGLAFLTAHQNIFPLTIQGNGTSLAKYTPNSAALTVNITPASIGAPTKTGGGASGTWGISVTGSSVRITSTTYDSGSLASLTTEGRLYHAGGGNTVTDKPSGVDAFGLFTMQTAGGWHGQILMSSNTATGLYWRTANNNFNGGWRTILDTTNYTSTLDSRYLRTVSLATISDLHSSWDALLKAAPSAYVTRWPTAAEVGALTQSTADSRYVNITGDTMTGDLGIGNGRSSIDGSVPYCGSSGMSSKDLTELANYKTVLGAYTDKSGTWYSIISVRHRNGSTDGSNYGLYLRSILTASSSLLWGKQYGSSSWQAERVILDSVNYTSYTVTKTGGGASGTWGIGISGNAATASKWAARRTITLTGAVTGSVSLDGSGNVSMATTYATGNISALDSRYVNVSGDTMTGLLSLSSGSNHKGAKVGNVYVNAIDRALIFQNAKEIRFGQSDNWAYNDWGGLTYDHTKKYLYLGIADGSIFQQNSGALSGGSLLTPGISNIFVGNNTSNKVWHAGNDGSGSGLDADLLDGWHGVGTSGSVLRKSGYVTSSTAGLSSYWGKLASFSWSGQYDDQDITLYLHSAYNGWYGIVALRGRWTSATSVLASVKIISGNISPDALRLYYDPSSVSGTLELWCNVGGQYNVFNAVVLSETRRTTEETGRVTLYRNLFSTAQTLPSRSYVIGEYVGIKNNAASATQLQTARQINGTNFNGTANITTAKWGTARSIYIRDASQAHTGAAVSVDGSANEYLLLPATITATLSGNASSATKLQTARTLWGQSFNGTGNVSGDIIMGTGKLRFENKGNCHIYNGSNDISPTIGGALANLVIDSWYGISFTTKCSGTYQGKTSVGIDCRTGKLSAVTLYAKTGVYSDGYVSAKGQNTSSDMRLKRVLRDVSLPLERIANAPSFLFSWKKSGLRDVGSSAQYWRGVLPEAVKERGGWLEMAYGNLALLSAISIARETLRIDREVTRLREECRRLRRRVARLEGAAGTRHLTAT